MPALSPQDDPAATSAKGTAMSDKDEPCVEILLLKNPVLYSPRQILRAMTLAKHLNAGEFYLLESPKP